MVSVHSKLAEKIKGKCKSTNTKFDSAMSGWQTAAQTPRPDARQTGLWIASARPGYINSGGTAPVQLWPWEVRVQSRREMQKTSMAGPRFECARCSKSFIQRQHLNRHIKAEHDGHRWACSACGKVMAQRADVSIHIKRRHAKSGAKPKEVKLKTEASSAPSSPSSTALNSTKTALMAAGGTSSSSTEVSWLHDHVLGTGPLASSLAFRLTGWQWASPRFKFIKMYMQ